MPIPTMGTWPRLSGRSRALPHTPEKLATACYPPGHCRAHHPPPPPAPSTPTAFAFLWPCHFPKRIRCQGKLAALRGKRVQADLILGLRLSPGLAKGGDEPEVEELVGTPSLPVLSVYHLSGFCMCLCTWRVGRSERWGSSLPARPLLGARIAE